MIILTGMILGFYFIAKGKAKAPYGYNVRVLIDNTYYTLSNAPQYLATIAKGLDNTDTVPSDKKGELSLMNCNKDKNNSLEVLTSGEWRVYNCSTDMAKTMTYLLDRSSKCHYNLN